MNFNFYKQVERLRLSEILLLALCLRLISAIFSRGYAMIDDHFLVIEMAQNWIDGHNLNGWLPDPQNPASQPPGFSFLYPGFHYVLFAGLKLIGITDPEIKMLIVRILHAFYSIIPIYFAYRIAARLSGKLAANWVGLILAITWFLPILSVRNLVEMVCMAPLMWGVWLLVLSESEKTPNRLAFFAGLALGLAFSVRFQSAFFSVGCGFYMLLHKRWMPTLNLALGGLIAILLVQGGIDFLVWKEPFIQMKNYVLYNMANAYNYITGPWYNYLLLIPGVFLPPWGIFLFIAFLLGYKRFGIIFLPTILFLAFHSFFPNKQERFIFPILPFVVLAGVLQLVFWYENQEFWKKYSLWLNRTLVFCLGLNVVLVLVLSPASTRISRVDAMLYLSKRLGSETFVFENTQNHDAVLLPRYYLGSWLDFYVLNPDYSAANLKEELAHKPDSPAFSYVLFSQGEHVNDRIRAFEASFGPIKYETTIGSSYLDRFMHWLNPYGNKNQDILIYRKVE